MFAHSFPEPLMEGVFAIRLKLGISLPRQKPTDDLIYQADSFRMNFGTFLSKVRDS